MELVLAALVTGLTAIIVAVITKLERKGRTERALIADKLDAAEQIQRARLERIEDALAAPGSNRKVGETVELLYNDLQQTKREFAAHERRRDAHGVQLWERRL